MCAVNVDCWDINRRGLGKLFCSIRKYLYTFAVNFIVSFLNKCTFYDLLFLHIAPFAHCLT